MPSCARLLRLTGLYDSNYRSGDGHHQKGRDDHEPQGPSHHDRRSEKGQKQPDPRSFGASAVTHPEKRSCCTVEYGNQPGWPVVVEEVSDTCIPDAQLEQNGQDHVDERHQPEVADQSPRRNPIDA